MKTLPSISALLIVSLLMLSSCGEKQPQKPQLHEAQFVASKHMPGEVGMYTIGKLATKRTYDELVGYVGDAGAAEFASYNGVGLAASIYDGDTNRVSVEVAQFATPLDAFGWYSRTRPVGTDTLTLGLEAFQFGNSLYYVQDRFVVTLSSMGDTETLLDRVLNVAITISASIVDNPPLDEAFEQFPSDGLIEPSFGFAVTSFRGIEGVDSIYYASYDVDENRLSLFWGPDRDGDKFLRLATTSGGLPDSGINLPGFGFDDDYGAILQLPELGTALVGLKDRRLCGVIGYDDRVADFVKEWIE